MKRSVILTDRLGPDILLVLTMKRQVLHRERAHLKVPGCSLVLSALLTKKLPTFLSRLNEISGGCEKILPVSGSFWSNLKLRRMMLLTAHDAKLVFSLLTLARYRDLSDLLRSPIVSHVPPPMSFIA